DGDLDPLPGRNLARARLVPPRARAAVDAQLTLTVTPVEDHLVARIADAQVVVVNHGDDLDHRGHGERLGRADPLPIVQHDRAIFLAPRVAGHLVDQLAAVLPGRRRIRRG